MPYNVKYQLEYTSQSNHSTKIEILKKDYDADIIELVGSAVPFSLIFESSSSDQFSTFKNSYCILEVKLTEALKADFIEIEDEDDFILRYYKNDSLYWTGYILQEQYYEGDDPNIPFVSLKFYDAISRLRVFKITDTTLDLQSHSFSLQNVFSSVNNLLYQSIDSTGFKGNDFLVNVAALDSEEPIDPEEPDEEPTGNCYTITIESGYESTVDGTLYITTTSPELGYRHSPFSEYSVYVGTGFLEINVCSDTNPVLRYSSTGSELSYPEGISIDGGASSCFSDGNCTESPEPDPDPEPTPNPEPYSSNVYDSVFLLKESFFDKDGIPISLYEILEDIASSFNFTYLLHIDSFYVHNFEFSKNPKFLDFGDSGSIISFTGHTSINGNQFWINKSKGLYFLDSLKKMEIFHKVDGDLNYLEVAGFTDVTKLREYVSAPSPITTSDSITFLTYADVAVARGGIPSRSYKDVSVKNEKPFRITNNSNKKYRLSFNVRFVMDYGITDEEFEALTDSQKIQTEEFIKEVEANTDIRLYYQIESVQEGVSRYLNLGRSGLQAFYDSGFEWTLELNTSKGLNKIGIDALIEGYDFEIDIPTRSGLNEMYISFFHPYVVTNEGVLSGSNTYRIEGVNAIISELKLIRLEALDLEELRFEGVTNRNVFNYNLNRDKEITYINLEEGAYKYSLLNGNGTSLANSPFKRKLKDYSEERDEALNVQDLILIQSLEQFGFQQQMITGDLHIRDNPTFNIFSTFTIAGKDLAISKYSLDDKTGNYSIELLEIK